MSSSVRTDDPSDEVAATAAEHPAAVAVIAGRVLDRLQELLGAERVRLDAVDPELGAMVDAVADLVLGGGKRLRPAFCYWGFVLGGGDPAEEPLLVEVCAALELLHGFALIHDDVMDGSTTRRGQPAVHVRFGARHDDGAWRGESRRFGEGVAIIAGDYAAVLADRLIDPTPARVRAVWTELQIEIAAGQYLDLLRGASGSGGVEEARRIARLKSGRYTVERPLHLGIALAGAPEDLATRLGAFGRPLGEAFQLRDDLLGAFGEAVETGKPVGDDLREGKPTALLALARQRAEAADRAVLDLVGSPDLAAEQIAEIRAVLRRSGALDAVTDLIDHLTDDALGALEALEGAVPEDGLVALRQLTSYVVTRAR